MDHSRNILKNTKALTPQAAAIIGIGILVVSIFAGVLMFQDKIWPSGEQPQQTPWNPWQPQQTPGSQQITPTGYSGILYLEVVNSVTGAGVTTSTTTVDVVAAENGAFNFLSGPSDTKAQAANPQAMNTIWPEGTELIIMTDCTGNPTNGLDFYPGMYYLKLYQGSPVYRITDMSFFQQVSSSPIKYQANLAGATPLSNTVQKYESSNVYYWNIGKLAMFPRQAAADLDIYLLYAGTELSKSTDGSTWDDDTTDMDANATLASDIETLEFKMVGANADLGWGKHFFVVNQQGKIEEYGSVLIMSTACTGLAVPNGWNALTMSNLYAEKGYYKILNPDVPDADVDGNMFPAKGSKASWTVKIHLDTTSAAASTAYLFKFWLADSQKLSDVPIQGSRTGTVTAYGFVTSYGLGQILPNTGFTVTSGAGETEQLCTYLTTAS